MAKEKQPYSSILDAFLDDRTPDFEALGLADAKKSGEEQLDRTHQYTDKEWLDNLAESASHHTPVPPTSKGATLRNRLEEKENATPHISAVQSNWHKEAYPREGDFKNSDDNDSLINEVTMSIETAYSEGNLKENSADKKEVSDAAVQSYLRGLLNSGMPPNKVAEKLNKLAEIELFNKGMATDYLQRNAGMLGMAYLEPNTFMDKENSNYRYDRRASFGEKCPSCGSIKTRFSGAQLPQGNEIHCMTCNKYFTSKAAASSNDCVRQHNAWKQAGIELRARSVKQIKACTDCSYFKKSASGKTCNLYHLPVVANANELSQIVNNLTPGVPLKHKRAALVQIANRTDEHVQPFDAGKQVQTSVVKTADTNIRKQAQRMPPATEIFTSDHLAKLHDRGVSLQDAYKWADKKFGSVATSVAFRGFVQSLRKNEKGRIVVASNDLQFLNSIGIRNEKFEASPKCASCPKHFSRVAVAVQPGQHWKDTEFGTEYIIEDVHDGLVLMINSKSEEVNSVVESFGPGRRFELVQQSAEGPRIDRTQASMRVEGKFAQRTASAVAAQQKEASAPEITTAKVRTLHQAGHSLEKIFNAVAKKIGTPEAKRIVATYLANLKRIPGRIQVNASDKNFLVRVGFKADALRTLEAVRPSTERITASTDDSPVLGYPGMGDPNKKTASVIPSDGHAILNEYDLSQPVEQQDIDVSGPERLSVETKSTFSLDTD